MRTFLNSTAVILLFAVASSKLLAASLGTPTDMAFTAICDGSTQHYVQLLPSDFDVQNQYDIVIALHGHGSDRWQYATGTRDEIRATRDAAANHNMIMICPDYRATTSWMGPAAEADMVQIIQDLRSRYNVGKTIVTGASMGGASSLTFTALHPDLVDGVCSINGLANFVGYQNFTDAISTSFGGTYGQVPQEYVKRSAINSPQAFTMPMSIAAGGCDTVIPSDSVLSLFETVKDNTPRNAKTACFYRSAGGHSTNYVDNAVALEYVIRQTKGIDTDLHPITINTSFEYQDVGVGATANAVVDGWTTSGSSVGVVHLTAESYAEKFDNAIPDGNQFAVATNNALYQFTGTTVRPGTYHLSFFAASEKGASQIGTLLAGFLVADNNVASVSDLTWGSSNSYTAGPGLTAGKWTQINVDWVVRPGSSEIGKCLYINLWANSSNAVCFDEVSLSYTHAPEPTSLILLCLGGLVIFLKNRLVGKV